MFRDNVSANVCHVDSGFANCSLGESILGKDSVSKLRSSRQFSSLTSESFVAFSVNR